MTRWAPLVTVLALAVSASAPAWIGEDDLARAAAELERARAAAGEAAAALEAARGQEQRARALLEEMVGRVAAGQVRLAEARERARQRARLLYVTAGADQPGAQGEGGLVRSVYSAVVGRADREAVTALRAALQDLERRRAQLQDRVTAQNLLAARLAELETAAGPAVVAAEAEYRRLRAAWEAQEAQRLRLEREAARTSTTTVGTPAGGQAGTPPVSSTTSSPTVPAVGGGPFEPLVERWRPLVAAYFPAELVEEALAVIACESLGDPAIVNRLSGTAGLFQHHPQYWPERAAAAGFSGAAPDDPEANIAAAAWLVGESMASGLSPWFFWACRP